MESDQIGSPSGEMQKICIRFKTAEIASAFKLAYENGVKDTGSESEVTFIQSDVSEIASPKSPVGERPEVKSPEVANSPPPPTTFSFGEKPAEIPQFGGFSFSSATNNAGFNFGATGSDTGNGNGGQSAFSFTKPASDNPFGFK